jgi:hypothetical protein
VRRLPREVLRKRDRHRTSTKFRLGVIRWVHVLCERPSLLRHPKKGSFKTTVTDTLTTVRRMKITPLLRYPQPLQHGSHRLPLHNSGAMPPVHEPFKRYSYKNQLISFSVWPSDDFHLQDVKGRQFLNSGFSSSIKYIFLLSLAPQPSLSLGLLHKIRLNFLEASQQFSLLQRRVVSPTPNPHPGVPGLCIYIPQRQGDYPF